MSHGRLTGEVSRHRQNAPRARWRFRAKTGPREPTKPGRQMRSRLNSHRGREADAPLRWKVAEGLAEHQKGGLTLEAGQPKLGHSSGRNRGAQRAKETAKMHERVLRCRRSLWLTPAADDTAGNVLKNLRPKPSPCPRGACSEREGSRIVSRPEKIFP